MRLAFIETKLNLMTGGGSNITLFNMAAGLKNLGHDVSVVTIAPHNNALPNDLPFPVHSRPMTGGDAASMLGRLAVVRELRRLERTVDIFQIETPSLILAGALYRALGGKVPVIARLHNYSYFCTNINRMDMACADTCSLMDRIRHRVEPRWRRILLAPARALEHVVTRAVVNRVDRFIALSPAVARIHQGQGIQPEKLVIITPPLDPTTLPARRDQRAPLPATSERPYRIVYVGRLAEEKGIGTLIQAVQRLPFPYALDIFGDGSDRAVLEEQAARSGVGAAATFHGWKSQAEIFDAFLRADLFVHPARWPEPAGRTVLEAMALGVPMVVSDVGGPPWLAGDAALTFPPGHADALHRQIVRLHDDPLLAETMARDGLERVKRFGLEPILRQLLDLYAEVRGTSASPVVPLMVDGLVGETSARPAR